MQEITEANVLDYLRTQDRLPPGPVCVELLGGGVSNIVLRIESPEHSFVLKQSRPQLRTRDAWFSDLERIYREQEVMQVLQPLLPAGVVPKVLFADRANFVFAMSAAPTTAVVWKQQLLAGVIDPHLGRLAGTVLGRLHEATARQPQLVEPFRDHQVFIQLRADPFYQRVKERRPEVANEVGAIIAAMLACKEAICHGDYTPKNMLVHGDEFTLVDYETACLGDPTMDIGLFLCHLVLKALHRPAQREEYFELMRQFWQGYAGAVSWRSVSELEERGIRHLAVCLLARVDGTSPVDYLPAESQREAVRRLGRALLREDIARWNAVVPVWEREIAGLVSM
jgi:5-methylthioribose kinase